MTRVARDVSVQLFRRTPEGVRFLMLHRCPGRGGFWQGVTGAPLPGESDIEAAIRETHEETGYAVSDRLVGLATRYAYALRPEAADRWASLYGPRVTSIPVVGFGAEVVAPWRPVLDPVETTTSLVHLRGRPGPPPLARGSRCAGRSSPGADRTLRPRRSSIGLSASPTSERRGHAESVGYAATARLAGRYGTNRQNSDGTGVGWIPTAWLPSL